MLQYSTVTGCGQTNANLRFFKKKENNQLLQPSYLFNSYQLMSQTFLSPLLCRTHRKLEFPFFPFP
jgi:hypothetical protein